MVLQSHEGITQEELMALLYIDKATTARSLKSLELKGYLIRLHDVANRRQNRLYLTGLKEPVRDELSKLNIKITYGIDPVVLDLFYSALGKMKKNLGIISKKGR